MGTFFTNRRYATRRDFVEQHILPQLTGVKIHAVSHQRGAVWVAFEVDEIDERGFYSSDCKPYRRKEIELFIIYKQDGLYGYKAISLSMHPYRTGCPEHMLTWFETDNYEYSPFVEHLSHGGRWIKETTPEHIYEHVKAKVDAVQWQRKGAKDKRDRRKENAILKTLPIGATVVADTGKFYRVEAHQGSTVYRLPKGQCAVRDMNGKVWRIKYSRLQSRHTGLISKQNIQIDEVQEPWQLIPKPTMR